VAESGKAPKAGISSASATAGAVSKVEKWILLPNNNDGKKDHGMHGIQRFPSFILGF